MKSNVAVCVCIGVGLLLISTAQRRRGFENGGGGPGNTTLQTFYGTNGAVYRAASFEALSPEQLADVRKQIKIKRRTM